MTTSTAYCLLLTVYCLLSTVHCLLLTVYCSLLTAFCLLPPISVLRRSVLPPQKLQAPDDHCLLPMPPAAFRLIPGREACGAPSSPRRLFSSLRRPQARNTQLFPPGFASVSLLQDQ